ncbi:hypothetical protein M3Y99_01621900 [Aphelenchoides fujianensis]|nr:hypothetical protein M3Y99_01621900 [Aphelenchoides fujianensis]
MPPTKRSNTAFSRSPNTRRSSISTTTTRTAAVRKQSQFGSPLQFPKVGGQMFQELCRLIRSFELCVDAYRDRCPKHITISLIEASYGYLCNEGYETFMASAECLMELDQQPAVKHCHDETLKDIEGANVESTMRMEAKMSRMCGRAQLLLRLCSASHSATVRSGRVAHTTRTLMPTCVFNGESAKLDAERRAEEHNRYARTRRPHAHPLLAARTTTPPPDDFAILPTSSMYSSTEVEDARSLEAERDEEALTEAGGGELRPPQPQRDDQPISFEIHEEIEHPPDQAANYERFRHVFRRHLKERAGRSQPTK